MHADKNLKKITLPYSSAAIQFAIDFMYIGTIPDVPTCEITSFDTLLEAFLVADYLELPFGKPLAENMDKAFKKIRGESFPVISRYSDQAELGKHAVEKSTRILLEGEINRARMYRILRIPSTEFYTFASVSHNSDVPSEKVGTYKTVIIVLIEWLKINADFKPKARSNVGVKKLRKAEGEVSNPLLLEIVEYAFEKIDFEKLPQEFIHQTVDCGLFSDLQMLNIFRSLPPK
ncbi:hypothetical protein HK098_002460 [Nowakowskiella sp. JEL0407]|nr:hypothetical protein HK098_002460 [Nowakowskiella sp. JEL0407]